MSRPSVTVISPKGESSETLVIPNVFRVSETPPGPGRANLHRTRISKVGTEKIAIGNGHNEFEWEVAQMIVLCGSSLRVTVLDIEQGFFNTRTDS